MTQLMFSGKKKKKNFISYFNQKKNIKTAPFANIGLN